IKWDQDPEDSSIQRPPAGLDQQASGPDVLARAELRSGLAPRNGPRNRDAGRCYNSDRFKNRGCLRAAKAVVRSLSRDGGDPIEHKRGRNADRDRCGTLVVSTGSWHTLLGGWSLHILSNPRNRQSHPGPAVECCRCPVHMHRSGVGAYSLPAQVTASDVITLAPFAAFSYN